MLGSTRRVATRCSVARRALSTSIDNALRSLIQQELAPLQAEIKALRLEVAALKSGDAAPTTTAAPTPPPPTDFERLAQLAATPTAHILRGARERELVRQLAEYKLH